MLSEKEITDYLKREIAYRAETIKGRIDDFFTIEYHNRCIAILRSLLTTYSIIVEEKNIYTREKTYVSLCREFNIAYPSYMKEDGTLEQE